MKFVSWNVNSIKARGEHVQTFLKDSAPDVLMIQELKGEEFPAATFSDIGYHSHAATQKAYNGVAILSKNETELLHDKLPGFEEDEQARYLEVKIGETHVINIYLPNGNPAPGDKYDYKLKWMGHLYEHLKHLRENDIPFLIGGDFNVIPEGRDCHDPNAWRDDALFRLDTRHAFRKLLNLGLYDTFRIFNNNDEEYTFWDYQAGAWPKNNGIRIDHFLLSPELVDKALSCTIDKTPRGWEKPSDHTPIIAEVDL